MIPIIAPSTATQPPPKITDATRFLSFSLDITSLLWSISPNIDHLIRSSWNEDIAWFIINSGLILYLSMSNFHQKRQFQITVMALKMAFNGFSNGFSTNIEYWVFWESKIWIKNGLRHCYNVTFSLCFWSIFQIPDIIEDLSSATEAARRYWNIFFATSLQGSIFSFSFSKWVLRVVKNSDYKT